jgi:DNA-binding CsgD family transcriptional regulator
MLVYGEAGIGKTRLCDQVGGAHRAAGGQLVAGRAVLDEAAIAFSAAAVLRRLGAPPPRRRHAAGRLSERELEVARLVADGLSNPAIAARLYLSRATVASHVGHILTRLGFSARTRSRPGAPGRTTPDRRSPACHGPGGGEGRGGPL